VLFHSEPTCFFLENSRATFVVPLRAYFLERQISEAIFHFCFIAKKNALPLINFMQLQFPCETLVKMLGDPSCISRVRSLEMKSTSGQLFQEAATACVTYFWKLMLSIQIESSS